MLHTYSRTSVPLFDLSSSFFFFFFFTGTAPTEIYTLSLHDALPICEEAVRQGELRGAARQPDRVGAVRLREGGLHVAEQDRKSTRLNSSHVSISYAVFCLKKKKNTKTQTKVIHNQQIYHNTTRYINQ